MTQGTTARPSAHKWWFFLAVGVGAFMAAFSGSVVNATLPLIQHDLAASVTTVEWVVTINLVLVSGLLLSFGRVGDLRAAMAGVHGGLRGVRDRLSAVRLCGHDWPVDRLPRGAGVGRRDAFRHITRDSDRRLPRR